MLIENLTVKEWRELFDAVHEQLAYHEDNAYRYELSGMDYPAQDKLDTLRSLKRKLEKQYQGTIVFLIVME